MTDDQRADFNTMKTLAPFTKLNPGKRMFTCNEAAKLLNKNNELIEISEEPNEL